MNEQEWQTCTHPDPMLDFIQGKVSDRKLRLFAVACCRRIWHLLPVEWSRQGVEMTERYADGLATDEQLKEASKKAGWAAAWAAHADAAEAAAWTAARKEEEGWTKITARRAAFSDTTERQFQSDLLRDIVGNPYRPVVFDTSWVTSAVTRLARDIYDRRAFENLLRLAEELEAAGCEDADILAHCQKAGPHVRGCWLVDLVLKQP